MVRVVPHEERTFQFTHPGRGATAELFGHPSAEVVSIHAPREGCDLPSLPLPLVNP